MYATRCVPLISNCESFGVGVKGLLVVLAAEVVRRTPKVTFRSVRWIDSHAADRIAHHRTALLPWAGRRVHRTQHRQAAGAKETRDEHQGQNEEHDVENTRVVQGRVLADRPDGSISRDDTDR